ncbi:unnamed protein product, partial [Urochloa humidicola]
GHAAGAAAAAAGFGAAGGAVRPRGGDDLRDADVAAVASGLGAELAHEVWREAEDGGGGEGAARLGGEDHLRRERDGGHGWGEEEELGFRWRRGALGSIGRGGFRGDINMVLVDRCCSNTSRQNDLMKGVWIGCNPFLSDSSWTYQLAR